jgi:DNA polymerase-3 subunit delta'
MFEDFSDDLDDRDDERNNGAAASRTAPEGLPPPRENPDCIGHAAVESMLLQLIDQSRLPHAMIFAGPKGIGKSTMAFRLARYLLNSSPSPSGEGREETGMAGLFGEALPLSQPSPREEGLPGNLHIAPDTSVFRQVASGGHPDLMTVERPYDEKKDRRKDAVDIDSIRKVAPFLRMTASKDNGWRIAIVDDSDTMTRQAQNAILKILEEPPQRAVLILVCHRPGALIPTIRSRCRMVNFQPLALADFSTLAKKLDPVLDAESLSSLHSLTDGSVGQARMLLEEGGLETLGKLTSLLAGFPSWNWEGIHTLADTLGRPGQEEQYRITDILLRWCVDRMVRATAGAGQMPRILNGMGPLLAGYTLNDWINIREALTAHLDRIKYANLDRRQGIIGAFTILSSAP